MQKLKLKELKRRSSTIKMLGKRGQSLGLAIISAIMVFIIGMLCINFVMAEVTSFRIGLSCASPNTISDATKLLCLVGDATVPYFILLVFSVSIGAIVGRLAMR